ncbi:TolC family protein [Hymenobacter sp. BT559]|uniref:TolC family protein n=1 Tax=Hymenobacter sp. BT559 TaxID=2795729 RepID=UPI0018EAE67F|nr:TolC family protein [Hymenobacter sp. BT559]MBJ6146341.1 TolC family protein [Hymenobacter sp. BT559]
MTAKTTCPPAARAALALAGLLAAGPVAAQAQTQPARPATAPAAALATPAVAATGPWGLQRTIDYALEHNIGLRINQLTVQSNAQVLRQSKAALLPTANLSASQAWQYGTSVNPLTYEFQSQTVRSNNVSGNSQLVLFQGFQLRNTIRRNSLDLQASQADVQKARNDLSLNVASYFLQLVLAQELVRANQFYVTRDQEQIARTKLLLQAGSIPESTLLDSQSQLATDELNVTTAQNQANVARLNLLQLLNLDPAANPDFQIEVPELPDPDAEAPLALNTNELFQGAATRQPEIKAADLRVLSAGRSVELARGAYYPRLILAGSVFSGFSSARTVTQIGGDSTARRTTFFVQNPTTPGGPLTPLSVVTYQRNLSVLPQNYWDQLSQNLGQQVQFALSIPILNGLQVRTNVQRTLINAQQVQLQAEQARLTLRQTIEQAYADARAAQLQYAAARRQVEALTVTQRNAEIRFNNGLLSGTEFNVTKNNLNFAISNQLQAKYTFIFRRKVLDFYQGKPLAL